MDSKKESRSLIHSFFRPRDTALKWLLWDKAMTKGMPIASYLELLRFLLLKKNYQARAFLHLMRSHRLNPNSLNDKIVKKNLSQIVRNANLLLDRVPADSASLLSERCIILKMPKIHRTRIEKGVLIVTFTETSRFFFYYVNCRKLLKLFYIVLEPSSSGYCDPDILFWTAFPQSPVIVQATERRDFHFLKSLKKNLIPVPFGASDWCDYRIFRPIANVKKIFDAVYVANFNPVKRVHFLLRKLGKSRIKDYRLALVLARWGGRESDIYELVNYYRLVQKIQIYVDLSQQEVNEVLNRSKVNMLLSKKEGSNRSIFEGFFANVPAILLSNNIGVNKSYINEKTGRLVEEKDFVKNLLFFRSNWHKYKPREWAMANISPIATTNKLNRLIQRLAEENGEPWRSDLVPKVNAPEVNYLYKKDKERMPPVGAIVAVFMKGRCEKKHEMELAEEIAALAENFQLIRTEGGREPRHRSH